MERGPYSIIIHKMTIFEYIFEYSIIFFRELIPNMP